METACQDGEDGRDGEGAVKPEAALFQPRRAALLPVDQHHHVRHLQALRLHRIVSIVSDILLEYLFTQIISLSIPGLRHKMKEICKVMSKRMLHLGDESSASPWFPTSSTRNMHCEGSAGLLPLFYLLK